MSVAQAARGLGRPGGLVRDDQRNALLPSSLSPQPRRPSQRVRDFARDKDSLVVVSLDEVKDGDLGLAPREQVLDNVSSDEPTAADDEAVAEQHVSLSTPAGVSDEATDYDSVPAFGVDMVFDGCRRSNWDARAAAVASLRGRSPERA